MTDHISTSDDETLAMAADFANAASSLFAAGSLERTFAQIIEIAIGTIEGCEYAGILLVEGDTTPTSIHTDPFIAEVDTLQLVLGEGPSLDASAQQLTFYVSEFVGEDRWPYFGPEAAKRGLRSQLALPLLAGGTRGSLNLYACYPQAFGVLDRARGLLLASIAAVASSTARTHEDEERRAANLHAALASRELIGQAQGILIERERITSDQAFAILRRASQHLNVKLHEVAQRLVDTGVRPETGSED
jgi:hypothetical protein